MIVTPSADLDLAERAITFAAVGTAGQRCTSLRRLFVHEDVYDRPVPRLNRGWSSVEVGNPTEGARVGPLLAEAASGAMGAALKDARLEGGRVRGGARVLADNRHGPR